jgi:formylglycine-generating enzyme required for sulfatase activity
MNRFFILFITVSMSCLLIFACGKKDDPKPKPNDEEQSDDQDDDDIINDDDDNNDPIVADTLTIIFDGNTSSATSKLSFNSAKDASLLIIKSDKSWSLASNATWLDFSSTSADAGATGIIVGARKNEMIPRNGEITISSDGKSHSVVVQQQGASEFITSLNGIQFKMILVKGGTFTMGSDQLLGHGPAHQVYLDSFYISETEITNELWKNVMGSLPYDNLDDLVGMSEYDLPRKPVSAVTWYDIMDFFLPEMNDRTGLLFTLPTEAQWEYAALGGPLSKGYDFAGENNLDKVAWYEFNSDGQKHEIKQKLPNELGLYDMSGNVSEWCFDWYDAYDWQSDDPNPSGPDSGTEKVVRGGNHKTATMDPGCHVKVRNYQVPGCFNGCWGNTGDPDEPVCFFCKAIGFRIVLEI